MDAIKKKTKEGIPLLTDHEYMLLKMKALVGTERLFRNELKAVNVPAGKSNIRNINDMTLYLI